MNLEMVALVGRPNVGKSTLFNRIAGSRIAVVSDVPGVTRDRLSADASWNDRRFVLLDTGGISLDKKAPLWEDIRGQATKALENADRIVLVTNAQDGIHPDDRDAADLIRTFGKPVTVAVNKAENKRLIESASEFYQLGFDSLVPISALHGIGIEDLLETTVGHLPQEEEDDEYSTTCRIAIVGRPNAGKSRMFNSISNEERSIVSDIPGTTRDPIDSHLTYKGNELVFIDTAGLKRRGKIERGIEQFSMIRTLTAIERADICLLMIDATEMVTAQDEHIAGFIKDALKGSVVALNKWDIANETIAPTDKELTRKDAFEQSREALDFLAGPKIICTDAKHGKGIEEVLDAILEVYKEYSKKIDDYQLNKVLAEAIGANPVPSRQGKQPRLLKIRQTRSAPPTMEIKTANAAYIHFSYKRYIINRLRSEFGFAGVPIQLRFVSPS